MSNFIVEAKTNWGDSNGKRWEDYDRIICPDGQTIDMKKLLSEQATAQNALRHLYPSLGGLLGKLRFIYTFKVRTQATDGYNILVNPQFTNGLNLTEKAFVMAHEVMHCLLNHLRRLRGRDMEKANIAGDYEVNCTLCELEPAYASDNRNAKSKTPFTPSLVDGIHGFYDKKFIGKGFETIYDEISGSSGDSMSNNNQSTSASKNKDKACQSGSGNQSQNKSQAKGSTGNSSPQTVSDARKAGRAAAIKAYNAAKK